MRIATLPTLCKMVRLRMMEYATIASKTEQTNIQTKVVPLKMTKAYIYLHMVHRSTILEAVFMSW